MTWASTAIAGKPADVFNPPDALPFALLYLHSLAEESPANNTVFTLALKQHRLRCIAPARRSLLVGGSRLYFVRCEHHS